MINFKFEVKKGICTQTCKDPITDLKMDNCFMNKNIICFGKTCIDDIIKKKNKYEQIP